MDCPWHTVPLRALLEERERLPHALLIHGPRGIGKRAFAAALARALLCASPRADLTGCGNCAVCRGVEQGAHLDFLDIRPQAEAEPPPAEDDAAPRADSGAKGKKKPATQILVDQVRTLREFVALSGAGAGGRRVVVVAPAEALNGNAANALLKVLEEPPAGLVFLLVSDSPARLLPTILSRCRRVALPRPSRADSLAWLQARQVTEAESLLDQAGGAPLAALDRAEPELQEARRRFLDELARLSEPAAACALAAGSRRAPLEEVLRWLATWCHDLARLRAAGQVRFNPDYAAALQRLAPRIAGEALFGFDDELRQAVRAVHHPLNPQLVLEGLLLSYCRLVSGAPHG